MTEESPFYGMVYWYTGRYGKNVERKMTVFFDKINKSILFVPKMRWTPPLPSMVRRSLNLCSTTPRPRSTSNSSTAQTLTPRTTSMRRSGSTLDSAVSSARLTSREEVCPHTTTVGSTAGSTTPTSLRSSPMRRPTRGERPLLWNGLLAGWNLLEERRCHKDLHLREEEQELPSWKDPLREQGYG